MMDRTMTDTQWANIRFLSRGWCAALTLVPEPVNEQTRAATVSAIPDTKFLKLVDPIVRTMISILRERIRVSCGEETRHPLII